MSQPFRARIRGLYAITACTGIDDECLLAACRAAIDGGATVLQYRDKQADHDAKLRRAKRLKALCQQTDVLLVINDDPQLACIIEADGLHIGGEDGSPEAIRRLIPEHMLLGVSCYGSLERAAIAADSGADYLAFGAMYRSSSKPDATATSPSVLIQARAFGLPVVAIGGITTDNAAPLIRKGADAIAVINGLFSDMNPAKVQQRARDFANLFM